MEQLALFESGDLLAIHFNRAADRSWYATGTFSDKTIGKNGQKVIKKNVPEAVVEAILRLLGDDR